MPEDITNPTSPNLYRQLVDTSATSRSYYPVLVGHDSYRVDVSGIDPADIEAFDAAVDDYTDAHEIP